MMDLDCNLGVFDVRLVVVSIIDEMYIDTVSVIVCCYGCAHIQNVLDQIPIFASHGR